MTTTTLKTVANPDARLLDLGALLDLAIECERKLWALVDTQPDYAERAYAENITAEAHQISNADNNIWEGIISPVSSVVQAILDTEPRTIEGWMVHARAMHVRTVGVTEKMPLAA